MFFFFFAHFKLSFPDPNDTHRVTALFARRYATEFNEWHLSFPYLPLFIKVFWVVVMMIVVVVVIK